MFEILLQGTKSFESQIGKISFNLDTSFIRRLYLKTCRFCTIFKIIFKSAIVVIDGQFWVCVTRKNRIFVNYISTSVKIKCRKCVFNKLIVNIFLTVLDKIYYFMNRFSLSMVLCNSQTTSWGLRYSNLSELNIQTISLPLKSEGNIRK